MLNSGISTTFPSTGVSAGFLNHQQAEKTDENSPLQLRKSFPVLTFTFWKKNREFCLQLHTQKTLGFLEKLIKQSHGKGQKCLYCYPETQLNLTAWVSKLILLRLACPLPPLSTIILRHNVTKLHHSQKIVARNGAAWKRRSKALFYVRRWAGVKRMGQDFLRKKGRYG